MTAHAPDLKSLRTLARVLGVETRFTDGLGRQVSVPATTLVRVCAALGAPVTGPEDARAALLAVRDQRKTALVPPVLVAWDGVLAPVKVGVHGAFEATLQLEDGTQLPVELGHGSVRVPGALPLGYHTLTIEAAGQRESATVISAPVQSWHRPGTHRSWGVGTHLAALRSARSRAVGDLQDFEQLCRWVQARGGDLVTALPLLPTFNSDGPEPSPYSPVSRLFWSELVLDLGAAHQPAGAPRTLSVTAADAEVRAALADAAVPPDQALDPELVMYARFRGAQRMLGRNWRDWPEAARRGSLTPDQVDPVEERFHLVSQLAASRQLHALRTRLDAVGVRLGLDLAVGVHSDGYDTWSRQGLFGEGISVGAPPDLGFPSGQDWGFAPVLPAASRREGHRYLAGSIAHQARVAGVLRVDHIMAWTRLYWIPHGLGLHEGTYVSYPADELFAVLTLESHRHRCEIVGENLGNVPREIFEALPRHRIWGMYLPMFQALGGDTLTPPSASDMALVGTHDLPTFAGWIAGQDIADRVRYGLLREEDAPQVRAERDWATRWIAQYLGQSVEDPGAVSGGAARLAGTQRESAGRHLAGGSVARGGGGQPAWYPVVRAPQLAASDAPPAGRDLCRSVHRCDPGTPASRPTSIARYAARSLVRH